MTLLGCRPGLIGVALVCGLIPSTARAACVNDTRLPIEFKNSEAVFTGVVLRERRTVDQEGFFAGDDYTIRVVETVRGTLSGTVQVFSENNSGRFPMEIGKQYVLFVHRDAQSRLRVDSCGNSAVLPDGAATVLAIRQLHKTEK